VVERSEVGDCGGDGTVKNWPRGSLGEGWQSRSKLPPETTKGRRGRRDVEMEAGCASARIASPGDEQGFRVPRVPVPLELVGLWPNWARVG
jgi:hypothetical protein